MSSYEVRVGREDTTAAVVAAIRDLDDPNLQFAGLNMNTPYYAPAGCNVTVGKNVTREAVAALVDFAADSEASPSLLVRAEALDTAIELLRRTAWLGYDPSESLQGQINSIENLLGPDMDEIILALKLTKPSLGGLTRISRSFDVTPYIEAVDQLLEDEGLNPELIYPDWHVFSGDPLDESDCHPASALVLLARLAAMENQSHRLPMNEFAGLVPLAMELQTVLGDRLGRITDINKPKLQRDAEQWHVLSKLPEARPYITQLESLRTAAQGLKNIFPDAYGLRIEKAAQVLMAKSSYAIRAHLENGKHTRTTLPLNGDSAQGLPLHLRDDEPLALLASLEQAITELCEAVQDDETIVTAITDEPDFKLFRLWNPEGRNAASLYIRPYGAKDFDTAVEYGNQHGVEASMSYVIEPDIAAEKLVHVGRHRQKGPDGRISIRLDREGVEPEKRHLPGVPRDPTQEQGTLSLDIGSVLGGEHDFGTQIGRFLGWGDMLRGQSLNETVHLNHVTETFGARDGQAAYFAAQALHMKARFEARQATPSQVEKYLARSALAA